MVYNIYKLIFCLGLSYVSLPILQKMPGCAGASTGTTPTCVADPEEYYGVVQADRQPKAAFAVVQAMFAEDEHKAVNGRALEREARFDGNNARPELVYGPSNII